MQDQLRLFAVEKRCNRCRVVKPLGEFHRRRASPDGIGYTCKGCDAQRPRDYAAYDRGRSRLEYQRERAKQPGFRDRAAAARRARPSDAASRVSDRERVKRWRVENPELHAAQVLRERARRSVGRDASAVEYALTIRHDPCSYCGGPAGEVDHIIPVAQGGTNDWMNLTAACRACNPSKSDAPLLVFLARKATA